MSGSPPLDYDGLARTYDERYESRSYSGVAALLQRLVRAPADVLEVGCGTGRWAGLLHSIGCAVTGLDPSHQMLRVARSRLPVVPLVRGRAERLPFPDDRFDAVAVVNALHHFSDPAAFVEEAHRVLRPGGVVVTVGLDPSRERDTWYVYDYFEGTRASDVRRFPSTPAIAGWLERAGFVDVSTELAHHLDETEDARAYLGRGGAAKHSTSALALLSEAEHAAGIERIRSAIRAAESGGHALELRGDLHLYATRGFVPRRGGVRPAGPDPISPSARPADTLYSADPDPPSWFGAGRDGGPPGDHAQETE